MSSSAADPEAQATAGDLVRVTADEVKDVAYRALMVRGASQENAEMQSGILLEGDLRGRHSHGLQRLPVLVERIEASLLDPAAQPSVETVTAATVRVDGNNGFGPVAAYAAVDHLTGLARAEGIAVATIRRANHLGMLAPYVERLSDQQLIGIAMTTSEALVHPWGGRRALIGTNPIAIAVPGNSGKHVVLDMSTSEVSVGEILHYASRGDPLPDGWAINQRGEPTNNAVDALNGAIAPFGGPKGYALGLVLEVLVATLTGTALGTNVRGTLDTDSPSTKGDVVIALDPATLSTQPVDLEVYLHQIRDSGGHELVTVPGDRTRASRMTRLRSGLTLPRSVWVAACNHAGGPTPNSDWTAP